MQAQVPLSRPYQRRDTEFHKKMTDTKQSLPPMMCLALADLDEEQKRNVIAAMSRREVQPEEIIIRSAKCLFSDTVCANLGSAESLQTSELGLHHP